MVSGKAVETAEAVGFGSTLATVTLNQIAGEN
jgi:hypothetical protein